MSKIKKIDVNHKKIFFLLFTYSIKCNYSTMINFQSKNVNYPFILLTDYIEAFSKVRNNIENSKNNTLLSNYYYICSVILFMLC